MRLLPFLAMRRDTPWDTAHQVGLYTEPVQTKHSFESARVRSVGMSIVQLCIAAVLGVGMTVTSAKELVKPGGYLANLAAELQRQWPTNRTVNIVCHGHSVPAGYFKTPVVDTFNAYPHLLHRGLKERFPSAILNVIVTAIGGEDSESGAERFERDVLSLRPDVVTIDYALNDRRIGLARANAAWRSMLTNALANNIKVILLTPTPDMNTKLDDPNDPLNQHAAQVRRLAAEFHVALVDSLEAFRAKLSSGTPLRNLMSQFNHPNREGHELVAAELLRFFPKE
jgi:acyl-CoA thioesterase I